MGKAYFRILYTFFFVALVVCGVCRIVLKLRYIDHTSGFYTANTPMVYLFNAVLLVAVLAVFSLTRLRKPNSDYPLRRRHRSGGILSILLGVAVLGFTIQELPEMLAISSSEVNLLGVVSGYGSSLLGFITSFAFLVLGFLSLRRREDRINPLLLLSSAVWQLLLLVSKFNSYSTITSISDNLLVVVFMVFSTLFLFGHARTVCGLGRNDGRNYAIPAGLCASLTGLLLAVPNYVYMLVNQTDMPVMALGVVESVYILLLSLYAIGFVRAIGRSLQSV